MGGGGNSFHATVDARGADLGAEGRVYRAIAMAHQASVSTAVQAAHERTKRVPQRA